MTSASTLSEYLNSQEELVREAALALPHQFSQCTYSLGPLRQAVYLCTTCPEIRGLCSACSVACHTDHEQIELYVSFSAINNPIGHSDNHPYDVSIAFQRETFALEPENTKNEYGQNFKGLFCRCHRTYDPNKEREAMIQCLACEDWFHESCCNLRERPPSREPSPAMLPEADSAQQSTGVDTVDDGTSDASSTGLPPPLISGDDYESFVCCDCVSRNPTLTRWAGTSGVMMIVRDNVSDPWRRLNGSVKATLEVIEIEDSQSASLLGVKRPPSPSVLEGPEAKRLKGSSLTENPSDSLCLAPPQEPLAQKILSSLNIDPESSLGTGDIFLAPGFMDRWCHCGSCLPSLKAHPYLLEEEGTYEPPEDPDSGLSLEELGMRALERIPRDRAIDGIHAFNEMRYVILPILKLETEKGDLMGKPTTTQKRSGELFAPFRAGWQGGQ
ncbi:hypothetical protein D9613_010658 [Agrocybe pediades]|uniref:Zinc finger PHD-type domain-containing protein n=1 Tax=Agrocybe pediades TaxID=84607 RepID=A0A8H4QG99_9AGAR|nr:hypothetical protein D9613_010658 [Agrocybe pediades]